MTFAKLILSGLLICMGIYLFVSAPQRLPDQADVQVTACRFEVVELFDAVNAINDAARGIYTRRIVGGGLKAGLKFGEDWTEPDVEKGPLPALFLRLTASRLERRPQPLGLYLGSDAPINKSNLFSAVQAVAFEQVKSTREPVFSQDDTAGSVGMYPDVASVMPCVTCHNDHPDSPRTDWKLDDMMGATTWTYPQSQVSATDYMQTVDAMLASVREAYQAYLDKTQTFVRAVPIGADWPTEGNRTLPTVEVFLTEVRTAAATAMIDSMYPPVRSGDRAGGLTCAK